MADTVEPGNTNRPETTLEFLARLRSYSLQQWLSEASRLSDDELLFLGRHWWRLGSERFVLMLRGLRYRQLDFLKRLYGLPECNCKLCNCGDGPCLCVMTGRVPPCPIHMKQEGHFPWHIEVEMGRCRWRFEAMRERKKQALRDERQRLIREKKKREGEEHDDGRQPDPRPQDERPDLSLTAADPDDLSGHEDEC